MVADAKELEIGRGSASLNASRDGDSPHPPEKENAWIKLMTKLRWYPLNMSSVEKLLILKLDLSILIFGCLSFFTKYLDQQSLTNAYVRYAVLHVWENYQKLTERQWYERRPQPSRKRDQLSHRNILGLVLHFHDSSLLFPNALSRKLGPSHP